MADDELKELVASIAVGQKKTDAQLAKTDAQLAKTSAKIDEVARIYSGVGNNQGAVAEEFYFNSLKAKPELNGTRFDTIYKNITGAHQGVEDEFDLLLVNGQEVFVIEVKYKAHENDFQCLFPEYADYRQHLGLAVFYVHDELKEAALEQGITVLTGSVQNSVSFL